MQTFKNEPTTAPSTKAKTLKRTLLAGSSTRLAGSKCRSSPLHEPGDPDATLVEQAHRQRHRNQGKNVGRRRDNGGEDENENDGVGSCARHELVGDQAETHQSQDDDRQFKRESEAEREPSGKGIVLLHCPRRRPAERLGVAKEKEDRFGQKPEVANEHAEKKKSEADKNGGQEKTLFHGGERRQHKLSDEIEEQRKRQNDSGVKGELKRNDDRIGDPQRTQRADLLIDAV